MVNLFLFEQSDVVDGDKIVIRDPEKVCFVFFFFLVYSPRLGRAFEEGSEGGSGVNNQDRNAGRNAVHGSHRCHCSRCEL